MSVTFQPEIGPIDHFTVGCLYCDVTPHRFLTEETAENFPLQVQNGNSHVHGCKRDAEICPEASYMQAQEAVEDLPEVNIANGNAMDVLDVLGIDYRYEPTADEAEHDMLGLAGVELCGAMDAQDFLGRVLMGLAASPESAEGPAHAAVGAPNIIRGYREAGYVQRILAGLHEVAQAAAAHNRQVTWA